MKCRSPFLCTAVVLSIGLVLNACNESPPQQAVQSTKLDPFQKAIKSGELVTIAGGGAYLVASSGVYYVQGERAVLVTGLPLRLPFAEVHPLADGTAILHAQEGNTPALYLLRGSAAVAITQTREHVSAPTVPNLREGYLFAINQKLHAALKSSAEQQLGAEEEYEPPTAIDRL